MVGVVLAFAGAQKVVAWSAWRDAARRQGVWPAVAVVMPPVEMVVGAWLVAVDPAPLPMGLATLLLLVFTGFLIGQIRAGSQVPCACFGASSSRPPGARDVVRNLALITALVVAAVLA